MSPKQRLFAIEYLVDLNAHRAALRAGYAPKAARQTASKLMRLPDVAALIGRELQAQRARTRITADRVLAEYARIAFADIARLVEWGPEGLVVKPLEELSADDRAAIAALTGGGKRTPRIRLHDKQRALDRLARHVGLFPRPGRAGAESAAPADSVDAARQRIRERLAEIQARLAPKEETEEK